MMAENCANPLLAQWIKEWWDVATSNNAKDRLTWKRAYESIIQYPLVLDHPMEATKLNGIGPKIGERLTEKMKVHCEENGLPMPTRAKKKRKRDTDDAEDELESPPAPHAPKKKARMYVPKPRSGAHAILIALSEVPEDAPAGLSKEEVIRIAQPHSDSSFKVPSDPTHFYTAWNSMKTLEKKELIYSVGRDPKRYALTEEGLDTVKAMTNAERNLSSGAAARPSPDSLPPVASRQNGGRANSQSTAQKKTSSGIQRTSSAPSGTSAAVIGSSHNAMARPIDPRPDIEDLVRQRFGTKEAFLQSMADTFFPSGTRKEQSPVGTGNEELLAMLTSRLTQPEDQVKMQGKESTRSRARQDEPNIARQNVTPNPRSNTSKHMTIDLTSDDTGSTLTSEVDHHRNPSFSTASRPEGTPTTQPQQETEDPHFTPIVVPAGSFNVELRIDNREVRTKSDRNYIPAQLEKAGIACEQRSLGVGDILWVARIHDQSVVSTLDMSDWQQPEIVLDYIVERKRLDDLDASIRDKRFLDQKFRLKRSGVRKVTYLIEDYGCISTMDEQQHNRMISSITSTQVSDGFSVERTRKLDDTIAYLARKTRLLKAIYEPRSLTVIPSSVLSAQNHLSLRAPRPGREDHYISYDAFQSLASKSRTLTLRDVFLKMLMCTRGITGEKAIEIQKHWRTPHELVNAFARFDTPKGSSREAGTRLARDRNEMIARVAEQLIRRKKIGKAVSAKVAEVWSLGGAVEAR